VNIIIRYFSKALKAWHDARLYSGAFAAAAGGGGGTLHCVLPGQARKPLKSGSKTMKAFHARCMVTAASE
jgi:hypothetical protein